METTAVQKSHKLVLNNRKTGLVTGVLDVLSFNLNEILLETEQGMLMVKGTDLHVNRVNLEKGEKSGEIYETGWKYEMGITKELFIFLSAILSGAIVRLVYRCISCLRNVIHHTHWIVELEDLAYWVGTAIFLFVQIYYTSSGSVRWYFVLGIGLGASAMSVFLVAVRKWYRKIVCPGSGFLAETLEKGRKKR